MEIISILLFPPACEHRLRSLHFKTDFHQQHLQGILLIDISYRFLPGAIAQEVEWSFNSHLHCLPPHAPTPCYRRATTLLHCHAISNITTSSHRTA